MARINAAERRVNNQKANQGIKAGNTIKDPMMNPQKPILKKNTQITNVSQGTEAERKVQGANSAAINPNQVDAYGNTQNVTYDANGQPTVTQNLSGANGAILNNGQHLTETGQMLAEDSLKGGLIPTTSQGDLNADRARIEDAQYNRLTHRLGDEYNQASNTNSQKLYNRGIGFNDQASNPATKALDNQYADAKAQAMQSAVATGGEEYQRDVLLNGQQQANQISNANSLSQLGTGMTAPNFQGFQAPGQLSSPVDINASLNNIKQGAQGLSIQQQALNKAKAGGGGGGGGQAAAPSAFSSGGPPGYG